MNLPTAPRLSVRILAIIILLIAVSLSCNFPARRQVTPDLSSIAPTLQQLTSTAPQATPTPVVQDVLIENGVLKLTIKSQTKVIRLEPPDGGDISGLKAMVFPMPSASLLMVSDTAGTYLSEFRFVSETDPENISLLLKPAQYAPYSQHNINAVDLSGLLSSKKNEAPLNSLQNTLSSLNLPTDFGLIVANPDPFADTQPMALYETPLPKVLVALPADLSEAAPVKSAMILSVHDANSLPDLADLLKAQTQKISLANLTGLSLKELSDLQLHGVNKLEKPDQVIAYFGEAPYEVRYNQKQIEEFKYYVNNIVIVDRPCGSGAMKDRIFAMDPPAGSELVPRDARITLYRCEVVSEEQLKVVNLQFSPQVDACQFEPINGLMDIALVVDVSGSMQGSGLASAKAAGIEFINKLNRENARIGLAEFESDARVLSQLTEDFDAVIGLISGLSTSGGTAIDKGLMAGYSILQASERTGVPKVLLLLSDGGSDAEAALAAASEIKAAGVTILTVGVGGANQSLLSKISSSSNEFVYSQTSQGLKELYSAQALRLEYAGKPAARNIAIRFKYNTAKYALLESLLDHEGRMISFDTVEWFIPELFPTEVVSLPVVLRPLDAAGDESYGTMTATYDQCADGPQVSMEPQDITQAYTQSITTTRLVIHYQQEMTGTLEKFQSVSYLLDPNTPGVFSVVIQGAGSELPPEIYAQSGKQKLYPLYTIWRKEEKKRISTFYIKEPQSYWLYIQSNSLEDVGAYTAALQRGEVIDPAPLDLGADLVMDSVAGRDTRVYDLRGVKEGDRVTITGTGSGSSFPVYPGLVSLDGEISSQLYSMWRRTSLTTVFLVRGEGPYRLTMPNLYSDKEIQYQISIASGDLASTSMGTLTAGVQATGQIEAEAVHSWTFQGQKSQAIDVNITIENPQENMNWQYIIFNPDGTRLSGGYAEESSRTGWTQLSQDGVYTLLIIGPYSGTKALNYTVDLAQKDLPAAKVRVLESGDTVQETAINGRSDIYILKITPGQVLSVAMRLSSKDAYGSVSVLDPQGQIYLSAQSFEGELALGPITIRYPGEYTLRVSVYTQEDVTYELTVELN